jgi:hypothetical protein
MFTYLIIDHQNIWSKTDRNERKDNSTVITGDVSTSYPIIVRTPKWQGNK